MVEFMVSFEDIKAALKISSKLTLKGIKAVFSIIGYEHRLLLVGMAIHCHLQFFKSRIETACDFGPEQRDS